MKIVSKPRIRPYALFLWLVISALSSGPVDAKDVCPDGEIIWAFRVQVGCRFNIPQLNEVSFIENALKLCRGTDHISFVPGGGSSDGQLLCFKARLSPSDGLGYSDAMVGPDEDHLRPAGLEAFDRSSECEYVGAGTLAWWPLDGRADPAAERIAENRLGVVQGPRAVSGLHDSALRFDGQDDFVQASQPLKIAEGDFSLETWVRTEQTSTGTLLDQRVRRPSVRHNPGDDQTQITPGEPSVLFSHVGFSLFIYQGRPGLQLADGPHRNFVSSAAIADGNWHHLAVTVDRDQSDGIRWYVDGTEVLPRFDPTGFQSPLSNAGPLRLGVRSFALNGYFRGDLDEVLVHRRALSPGEVAGAVERPRCKTAAPAATCEFTEVVPPEPREFQSVDFIGFVHIVPSCIYSWAWEVDGDVIADTPSVNGFTGLSEGDHLVCLNVTDGCSPIACRSCRKVSVGPSAHQGGTFCGRSFADWVADDAAGRANIIDETATQRREITGTNGRDLILGNDLNNTITGLGGDDCIYGFGGNDSIHGDRTGLDTVSTGNDEIHGGPGNDHLEGDAKNDQLFGEDGDDYLEGDSGDDILSGGGGNDRIHGDSGNDSLEGGDGSDCLVGDSGRDVLRGGSGNDDLKGDAGRDQMWGGEGRDALKGDSGRDQIHGGPGPDLLKGDSSGDDLFGDAGNDRLCGDGNVSRRDRLDGGNGSDGCRSGARTSCESRLRARDCQTSDWSNWNSSLSCP